MNIEKLFTMQKGLDHHIETKHQLQNENLFNKKTLALLVELGELANETRCFKFWSLKPSSDRETILEEYVDGIHFILSLGIECGFANEKDYTGDLKIKQTMTEQFLYVYDLVSRFKESRLLKDYKALFQAYIDLGKHLGFNGEDIEKAYIEKNEVNYERQKQGY